MDFDKIVRDNVPEIIEQHGRKYVTRQVNDLEAISYLIKKLHEEADEVQKTFDANAGEKPLIEELGDVLGCVRAIAAKKSISMDWIDWYRSGKAIKNGTFDLNIILVSMEGDKF